jgi:predicted nucleic acid-binding protein
VIVVDASVALAWVLPDTEAHQKFAAQIAELGIAGTEELAAPRLLSTECGYRLLKYGRSHRWGEAKIAESAEIIDLLNLRYFEFVSPMASLIRFAVRHHVQGYDAVYLGLALHLGAPLATLDGGLRTAARSAGVALV